MRANTLPKRTLLFNVKTYLAIAASLRSAWRFGQSLSGPVCSRRSGPAQVKRAAPLGEVLPFFT